MALTDSLPTQDAGGLTIVDERLILAGDIVSSAAGVPRTGVLPSHTNALVTALSSMAVSVASFSGVFSRTGAGIEKAANNGATTVALDAAPGSNSRIDVVWARAQFASAGDANSLVVFGKTTGTAAASPSKPGLPPGVTELATVLVPSTATTTQSSGVVITQTHQYTAMEGGTVLLRNQAEQDAWAPHNGAPAYRLDTGMPLIRRGGRWVGRTSGSTLAGTTGGTVATGVNDSGLASVTLGSPVPAGSTISLYGDVEIYFPPAQDYGGSLSLRINGTTIHSRRWHSHSRAGREIYPALKFEYIVPVDLGTNSVIELAVSNDPLSNGAIEVWYAYLSWSVA